MISLTYLTCALMSLAMIAVWLPGQRFGFAWLWLLAGTMICAVPAQLMTPIAGLWVALALGLLYLIHRQAEIRVWLTPLLAIYLFAMGFGILPGFSRVTLIEPDLLGQSTAPYGWHFGLAKPIAGLLVFALLGPRCHSPRELFSVIQRWRNWLLPALIVLFAAWGMGVAVDIKWPWWTPLFLLSNCLFSALPEEAFFRTFFQHPLQVRFNKAWWIIPLVGALFACVHVPPVSLEAWRFFLLIFIAGMAYAWSFRQTGRMESALLTHICVNGLHFVLLTYPLAF